MDKQELINDIEKNKNEFYKLCTDVKSTGISRGIATGIYMGLLISQKKIGQLAEQPKVTVPQFVADWFEANKHRLETAIWDLTTDAYVTEPHQSSKIQLWLKVSDSPYETLILMKDGYEIEKEPVYEVEFFRGGGERYLLMELGEKSYEVAPESENDGYRTQWFTESEIKSIDERYWAFAVPVEEVK